MSNATVAQVNKALAAKYSSHLKLISDRGFREFKYDDGTYSVRGFMIQNKVSDFSVEKWLEVALPVYQDAMNMIKDDNEGKLDI